MPAPITVGALRAARRRSWRYAHLSMKEILKPTIGKLAAVMAIMALPILAQWNLTCKIAIEFLGLPFVPICSRIPTLYTMDYKFHAYTPRGDFVIGAIYAATAFIIISTCHCRKKQPENNLQRT